MKEANGGVMGGGVGGNPLSINIEFNINNGRTPGADVSQYMSWYAAWSEAKNYNRTSSISKVIFVGAKSQKLHNYPKLIEIPIARKWNIWSLLTIARGSQKGTPWTSTSPIGALMNGARTNLQKEIPPSWRKTIYPSRMILSRRNVLLLKINFNPTGSHCRYRTTLRVVSRVDLRRRPSIRVSKT